MSYPNPRSVVVLCGSLLAVLLLTQLLFQCQSAKLPPTESWTPRDFREHLWRQGVQLYLVPSAQDGRPGAAAYLTEDPGAPWDSLQRKARMAERIDQWQGTVFVERVDNYSDDSDVENDLGKWGT